MKTRTPKIALVSIGVGRYQRGFERYFSDLHALLKDDLDIVLYKGAGATTASERVPHFLPGIERLARLLPLGVVAEGAEFRTYKHDCLAYALTLFPELVAKKFDVVHIIDFPLGVAMHKLSQLFPFGPRLLFTNGCCMPHQFVPRSAHVHHVAQMYYEDALRWGVPAGKATLVPCGFYPQRFAASMSREELRRHYGIAESTTVIAVVCAVKKAHKRVDFIIDEISRLPGDILLWIDGAPEDPDIPEIAKARLGERCRITYLPSDRVGDVYNVADVMVHAAVSESFGLSIVEGLSTGLPVIVHDSPHFEWLTGDRRLLVDMTAPGALRARLENFPGRRLREQQWAENAQARFDWRRLAPAYKAMYARVESPA